MRRTGGDAHKRGGRGVTLVATDADRAGMAGIRGRWRRRAVDGGIWMRDGGSAVRESVRSQQAGCAANAGAQQLWLVIELQQTR
jgi:hypothetical protein